MRVAQWRLIPAWAKEAKFGNQCINAKGETVAERPAYRLGLKKRRCLMVANGFMNGNEWESVNNKCGLDVRTSSPSPLPDCGKGGSHRRERQEHLPAHRIPHHHYQGTQRSDVFDS